MSEYRAYLVDSDGHFHSSNIIQHPTMLRQSKRQSPWLTDTMWRSGSLTEKSPS